MSDFFTEALNVISGSEFDENPVSIETFVKSPDYLGLPPLSDIQYTAIRKISTIFDEQTYRQIHGDVAGSEYFKKNRCNEVVLVLGKGAGKDYLTTIAIAYVVYQILCLKDPQKYYGKPPGDPIHIMNIAINAKQANQVFFKGFMQRIEHSPWFLGKYLQRNGEVDFDKGVTVVSGHSESESLEGYNVIIVVLDEISGFKMESASGNPQAVTAQSTYDMHKDSVTSRFPKHGCLVMLSFPRSKNDFILNQYYDVIAEAEEIQHHHVYKLNNELPDGTEGNEFSLDWVEEKIVQYKYPNVFALRAASWVVNPTKEIEDYKMNFYRNPRSARTRFLCDPTETDDSFFQDIEKVVACMTLPNGVDEAGRFMETFQPKEDTKYYMHIDLAQKRDRAVASLAHVDDWVKLEEDGEIFPKVVVDSVRWWTPSNEKTIDYKWIREYVMNLRRRGFNIHTVTFDRWGSVEMIDYMIRNGMKSEILSVALKHFEEFALLVYDNRIKIPNIELLRDELIGLKVVKEKIVGSGGQYQVDDLAYATAGAVYNAITLEKPDLDTPIDIITHKDIINIEREKRQDIPNLIVPPQRQEATAEVEAWLNNIEIV